MTFLNKFYENVLKLEDITFMKFTNIQIPNVCIGCCGTTNLHTYPVNLKTAVGTSMVSSTFKYVELSENFLICKSCQEIEKERGQRKKKIILYILGVVACLIVGIVIIDDTYLVYLIYILPMLGVYIYKQFFRGSMNLKSDTYFIQLSHKKLGRDVDLVFLSKGYARHFKDMNIHLEDRVKGG